MIADFWLRGKGHRPAQVVLSDLRHGRRNSWEGLLEVVHVDAWDLRQFRRDGTESNDP